MRRPVLLFLLLLSAYSARAGQDSAQFVLAKEFLLADPYADPRLAPPVELAARFRQAFAASFPSRVIAIGPTRLLRPEELVVVIVPRLTAARVAHEVAAGTVHKFDASIVGSVAALDPWTGAELYAATRMTSARVTLGASSLGAADADLKVAFHAAFESWMRACFTELETKLNVFALRGVTVAVPVQQHRRPGGLWPFGLERGLQAGTVLTGLPSRAARVTAAFDHYSQIVDAVEPDRVIPPGEAYSLTVAQQPAQRREPRIAVSWVGPEPSAPAGLSSPPLSADAETAVFLDYLSKNSSLRILLPDLQNGEQQAQLNRIAQEVTRGAGLVERGAITLHSETLRQLAKERPEFRIVLFAPGSYAGIARGSHAVQHRYRATLGAAVLARHGEESLSVYGVTRVFQRNEYLGRNAAEAVREVDHHAAMFTVWRNAAIELAREILASAVLADASAGQTIEAEVGADRQPAWPMESAPDPHAPLLWLRPYGTVVLPSQPAQPFWRVETPRQGYLTSAVLARESLLPGDRLRYTRSGKRADLLAMRFELAPPGEKTFIDPTVLALLAAGRMAVALHREIALAGANVSAALPDGGSALRCHVSSLAEVPSGEGVSYAGQWRWQLLDTRGQVRAKLGRESVLPVPAQEASGLSPPDFGAYRLQYLNKSLDELAGEVRRQGFDRLLQ